MPNSSNTLNIAAVITHKVLFHDIESFSITDSAEPFTDSSSITTASLCMPSKEENSALLWREAFPINKENKEKTN
jgi:hypothetical protein